MPLCRGDRPVAPTNATLTPACASHAGRPLVAIDFSHGFFVFFACFVVSDVRFLVLLVFILSIHVCSVS